MNFPERLSVLKPELRNQKNYLLTFLTVVGIMVFLKVVRDNAPQDVERFLRQFGIDISYQPATTPIETLYDEHGNEVYVGPPTNPAKLK